MLVKDVDVSRRLVKGARGVVTGLDTSDVLARPILRLRTFTLARPPAGLHVLDFSSSCCTFPRAKSTDDAASLHFLNCPPLLFIPCVNKYHCCCRPVNSDAGASDLMLKRGKMLMYVRAKFPELSDIYAM